jgi:hypothetical protein
VLDKVNTFQLNHWYIFYRSFVFTYPLIILQRGPYREEHLALATEMAESGACVSGGASSPPGSDVPTGGKCEWSTLIILIEAPDTNFFVYPTQLYIIYKHYLCSQQRRLLKSLLPRIHMFQMGLWRSRLF